MRRLGRSARREQSRPILTLEWRARRWGAGRYSCRRGLVSELSPQDIDGENSCRKRTRRTPPKTGACLVPGAVMFRILVYAAAGFAAEAPGPDILHQQRSGTVFVSHGFVQVFEDAQARVQTHEVDQLERPHGVIEAEFQG